MSRPLYEHTQTGWPIRIAFLTLAFGLLALAALPDFDQMRTPPRVLAAGVGIAAPLKLANGHNLLVGSDEPRRLQAALQRAAARA